MTVVAQTKPMPMKSFVNMTRVPLIIHEGAMHAREPAGGAVATTLTGDSGRAAIERPRVSRQHARMPTSDRALILRSDMMPLEADATG